MNLREQTIVNRLRAGGQTGNTHHEHRSNMLVSSETIHPKNAVIMMINYSFLAKMDRQHFWDRHIWKNSHIFS